MRSPWMFLAATLLFSRQMLTVAVEPQNAAAGTVVDGNGGNGGADGVRGGVGKNSGVAGVGVNENSNGGGDSSGSSGDAYDKNHAISNVGGCGDGDSGVAAGNGTSVSEDNNNGGGGDDDDDDDLGEFEEKILLVWVEHFIDKYYKNSQSPTESTNIQRIAKKGRTSSSTATPVLKNKNIAPFPAYPILFNPYYQSNIYSNYIPLPYGYKTRLIPISQVPYSQNVHQHRFLTPMQSQYPYGGYTYAPDIANSNYISNYPKNKKLLDTQIYNPSSNQGETMKYITLENVPTNPIKKNLSQNLDHFDQNPVHEQHPEEPIQIDHEDIEESNKPKSLRNQKFVDSIDSFQNPQTIGLNQTNESHPTVEHKTLSTTIDRLNTITPLDKISEKYHTISTITPTSTSNTSNPWKLLSNDSDSQLPTENSYQPLDKSQFVLQISTSTQEPSFASVIEQTETTIKKELINYNDTDSEETPFIEENKRSGESRKDQRYQSLNDKNPTTAISETTVGKKSTTTNKVTQSPKSIIKLSTIFNVTTTNYSTPLCINSECQTSTMSSVVTPNVDKNGDLYNSVIEPIDPITKIKKGYNNYNQQFSSSTHSSQTSATTIPEATMFPYKILQSSTIREPSIVPSSEEFSPTNPSRIKVSIDKNDEIQTKSLHSISPLTNLQLITTSRTNNETSTENNTEQITMNDNKPTKDHLPKQKTNYYELSELSTSPPPTSPSEVTKFKSFTKIIQNLNHTTVKKANTGNKDDTENLYHSVTTKEIGTISLKSTTTTTGNPRNLTKKKTPLVITSNDSKNIKSNLRAESLQTPQTFNDSELWYRHINIHKPHNKELNIERLEYLYNKLVQLFKPEIEKYSITEESINRLGPKKLGDRQKLIYILLPFIVRDLAENRMEIKKPTKSNTSSLQTSD